MSTFDQIGEQYWAATEKPLGYNNIGWFPEDHDFVNKGEYNMFKEAATQSQLQSEQGNGSQSGCGSQQHRTPVAVDEKAASEQAVRDEVVRARNKAVRVHHKPEAEGVPPFSDHSGSL